MVTLCFHQLPYDIEQIIFNTKFRLEENEHYARVICKVPTEFVAHFWKGKYNVLKQYAMIHNIKCKGIKYIISKLPHGFMDNEDMIVQVAKEFLDEYDISVKYSERFACLNAVTDYMIIHKDFVNSNQLLKTMLFAQFDMWGVPNYKLAFD